MTHSDEGIHETGKMSATDGNHLTTGAGCFEKITPHVLKVSGVCTANPLYADVSTEGATSPGINGAGDAMMSGVALTMVGMSCNRTAMGYSHGNDAGVTDANGLSATDRRAAINNIVSGRAGVPPAKMNPGKLTTTNLSTVHNMLNGDGLAPPTPNLDVRTHNRMAVHNKIMKDNG